MNKLVELTDREARIVSAFFTRAFDAEDNNESAMMDAGDAIEYFVSALDDDETDTWARALGKLGVKGMMTRDGEVS